MSGISDAYESQYLRTEFASIPVYTLPMRVQDVVFLHYVAVRGKDEEQGSVQRVLSQRRVAAIKQFILKGNRFFNTFILNWTDSQTSPTFADVRASIPIVRRAAQVIDGQHRLAGLEAAMREDGSIGTQMILVSLCVGLSTAEAARIFLNINSEQKPVPKSLIIDLFGEVEPDPDHHINRAKDIADELNENLDSPFYKTIIYPGMTRGAGFISLSTVVAALQSHLKPDGVFARLNLTSFDYQKMAVLNYFLAIKSYYDPHSAWKTRAKNPFFTGAGFNGAIDYLVATALQRCAEKRSFSVDTFKDFLRLDEAELLTQHEIKKLDGKTAKRRVKEYLGTALTRDLPDQQEYEF